MAQEQPSKKRPEAPADIPPAVWNEAEKARTSEHPAYQTREEDAPGPVSMAEAASYGQETRFAGGSIRELGPKKDASSLKKAEEAAMPAGHVPYWARRDEIWEERTLVSRSEEIADEYDGARLIINKETGKPFRRGADVVLMAIPEEHWKRRQAEIDAVQRSYDAQLELVEGEDGSVYESNQQLFDKHDKEALDKRARQQHRLYERMGLTGQYSRTSGLSLDEALRLIPKAQREADEAYFRNMGMHQESDSEAQFKAAVTGQMENRRSNFAFPGVGFGPTTRESVRKNIGKS